MGYIDMNYFIIMVYYGNYTICPGHVLPVCPVTLRSRTVQESGHSPFEGATCHASRVCALGLR